VTTVVELLSAPVTVFLAALGLVLLLYLWGGILAPPRKPGGAKEEMYTGGEKPPRQVVRPSYQFYHVALFFTVVHIGVLVLATATGPPMWVALAYLGILATAVAALPWR
jgi:NADH:ubiquinone oxidoreductase subunit 3 (subunit A)